MVPAISLRCLERADRRQAALPVHAPGNFRLDIDRRLGCLELLNLLIDRVELECGKDRNDDDHRAQHKQHAAQHFPISLEM